MKFSAHSGSRLTVFSLTSMFTSARTQCDETKRGQKTAIQVKKKIFPVNFSNPDILVGQWSTLHDALKIGSWSTF